MLYFCLDQLAHVPNAHGHACTPHTHTQLTSVCPAEQHLCSAMGGKGLMPKISLHISAIAKHEWEAEQQPNPGAMTHSAWSENTKKSAMNIRYELVTDLKDVQHSMTINNNNRFAVKKTNKQQKKTTHTGVFTNYIRNSRPLTLTAGNPSSR